jgi:hypothetical protein
MAIGDSSGYSFSNCEPTLIAPTMFVFSDDELKAAETQSPAPGHVQFDERGNAVYAWRDGRMEQDGPKADRLREKALRNPELKLIEDAAVATSNGMWNDRGLQAGYNPYQSGLLAGKKSTEKKTDMRELSKWIEMKRRLSGQQPAVSTKK